MKKIAIIYNGKNENYEAHHYNILFKILPLGNPFTYFTSSLTIERLKRNVEQEINGKYKLIEICEVEVT